MIALVGFLLFIVNIQFPRGHNFDEFHYVPAAKEFLKLGTNRNWEHPPLPKYFIAAGMALDEDRPFGWRWVSCVFGAITLAGMYFWALALFRQERLALFVTFITLCNHMLYVQSRIAMLDIYMMAFLVWALAFFTRAADPATPARAAKRALAAAGVLIGLTTACKWFGMIPWLAILGVIVALKLQFSDRKSFWRKLGYGWIAAWWLLIPAGIYMATFLPLLLLKGTHYGFWDLFLLQGQIWSAQSALKNTHPYLSSWYQWPLISRPIWYAFDHEPGPAGWVRGVLFLGNPLVMWSGLVALGFCAWNWFKEGSRVALLILFFYGVLYLSWAVIPRHVNFYYYYFPAGMSLSLAVAYVFSRYDQESSRRRTLSPYLLGYAALCLGIFVYFFPVLAALRIPTEHFKRFMWFSSWV